MPSFFIYNKLLYYVINDVKRPALRIGNDSYRLVAELELIGLSDDCICFVTELFNGLNGKTRSFKTVGELGTARIDSDAYVGYEHIANRALGDKAADFIDNARNTAADKRRNDNGKSCALGSIGMAAYSAADYTVGTGKHVDVKVSVDLKSGKNDDIELMDSRAFIKGAGVLSAVYLYVSRVVPYGTGGFAVKSLNVEYLFDLSVL